MYLSQIVHGLLVNFIVADIVLFLLVRRGWPNVNRRALTQRMFWALTFTVPTTALLALFWSIAN